MNRSKFLVAVIAIIVSALGIYSCNKDETKNELNDNFTTENRSALPTVINGMLHFDTYADFEMYVSNLQELENDTNQVKTAYILLGVDLTQEFLPNLTDYPVTLRKEQQLTVFISARKAEETIINNALNSGDDSVFSIVSDPFFKSAINPDNSVHIGTRIFKFFDNERLAIVLNNDWNTYNTIKNSTYDQLSPNKHNLLITSTDKTNWSWTYNVNGQGDMISEKEIVWPNVPAIPGCDFSTSFVKTTQSNGDIKFQLNLSFTPPIVEWRFSDGTILTGNPVTRPCTSSGTVTVILRNSDGYIICVSTNIMSYECNNCGVKKSKDGQETWTNAGGSGKRIRIDATIWVKDGEIGCRSKHFGRNIVGIWVPLNLIFNTTGVFANIQGSFKREVTQGNCIVVNQPFNEKQLPPGNNATWQNIISQPGKNFVDPGKLSSGHRIRLKTGGTFFGFGVDRPRLILD